MDSIDRARRGIDWPAVADRLDGDGWARLPGVLPPGEQAALKALWDADAAFRSTVVMARHGYGEGTYRYFARPLPPAVERLREALYPPLAAIANRWHERLGIAERFPDALAGFLARCHAAGQRQPTPLLLRYGPGGWNALHRDLYGAVAFPLQIVVALSEPGRDYEGGEFLLVEQRPRAQSAGRAVRMAAGDALVFPNDVRPARGRRGWHRVRTRHGVSRIDGGERMTLGIIFHDAA